MEAVTLPRRELTILAVALVGASRLVEGSLAWFITACVFGTVFLGARHVLGSATTGGLSAGRLAAAAPILPATMAAGGAAAVHVLGFDGWLLVALAAVAVLVDRSLAQETSVPQSGPVRAAQASLGPSSAPDRAQVLGFALLVAFVGFVGVGALVPGGLAEPVVTAASPATPLPLGWLIVLALGDGVVAGLVGLRLSALASADTRDIAWSAATYATIAAIAAAALRALAMPRFLGPALLTLLLYLWSGYRGSTRATRRSVRWIWESALLLVLVIAVVAWNVVNQ